MQLTHSVKSGCAQPCKPGCCGIPPKWYILQAVLALPPQWYILQAVLAYFSSGTFSIKQKCPYAGEYLLLSACFHSDSNSLHTIYFFAGLIMTGLWEACILCLTCMNTNQLTSVTSPKSYPVQLLFTKTSCNYSLDLLLIST